MKKIISDELKNKKIIEPLLTDILFDIYLDLKLDGKVIFMLKKNFYYDKKKLMQDINLKLNNNEEVFYSISVIENPVDICIRIENKENSLFMEAYLWTV